MRVPPTLLPTLIADSSDEVTAALRSAWGARGAWLAEPDGASGTPDATSRTSRADLEKQWSTMPARAKQEALEALGVGLSMDDEPLLERCLDERSARVRDAARLLLSELTSSRYSARMADRLRPLVTRRTPSVARRLTALVSDAPVLVDVHPPTALDAAADRDGLPALHSDADRTKALRAIVVAAPLDTWTRLLDATPERIVAGLSSDATVIDAMARAAIRQHDSAWAAALARYSSSPGLTETMTPADRERELLQRLRSEPDRQVPQVLSRLDAPWSETIADAVLDRLAAPPVVQKGHAQGVTLPTAYAVAFPAAALPRIQYILDQPVPDADATGAHSIIGSRRALLQAATTFHAFDRSIQEAFA
nr:DUF5691 domain-containing protein [Gordonia humi]